MEMYRVSNEIVVKKNFSSNWTDDKSTVLDHFVHVSSTLEHFVYAFRFYDVR